MGLKRIIRKVAKFIVFEQPKEKVIVHVGQIQYGKTLKDRNIVITGGGSGLGLAMAKKFISEGAHVLIIGRNEEKLKNATLKLGNASSYFVFDVSKASEAEKFFEECEKRLKGPVDSFVSNAGVSLHENVFTNVTLEGFDKQFGINMRGNYFLCKAFLQRKLKDPGKTANLLVISSETANQAYDIPYGMTKAAVNSMIKAFSRRVYQSGIRVNAIAPGVTLSEMTKEYADGANGNLYRDCASGRIFLPEEVAEVACFLLSDASQCISGEIIHTNAGNHIKTFWDK